MQIIQYIYIVQPAIKIFFKLFVICFCTQEIERKHDSLIYVQSICKTNYMIGIQ